MSVRLVLDANTVDTSGAVTATADSITLPEGFHGTILCEVVGELSGTPADGYSYKNRYLVSCDGGVAVVQDAGIPEILDPSIAGVSVNVNASGAAVRIRVTGAAGEDWRWVGKISGVGEAVAAELMALGVTRYYDASQTNLNVPYEDAAYVPGAAGNLVVDGDMELVGIANWPGTNSVPTKDATAPAPFGTQCLRGTATGAGISFSSQACLNTSQRFRITAQAAGDGVGGYPLLYTGGVGVNGPGGTAWVPIALENHLPTTTSIRLRTNSGTAPAGLYSRWDDVDAHRLPILTQSDDALASGTNLLQAGAVGLRPTYLPLAAAIAQGFTCPAWQTDGVAQYFDTGYTPVDNFAISGWFYVDSVAAGTPMFAGSALMPDYCQLWRNAAVLTFRCGLSGATLTHGTPLTVGWHYIAAGRRGTSQALWLDGVITTNALGAAPPVFSLYLMAQNAGGVASGFRAGLVANFGIWNHLPNTDEILTEMALTRPPGV